MEYGKRKFAGDNMAQFEQFEGQLCVYVVVVEEAEKSLVLSGMIHGAFQIDLTDNGCLVEAKELYNDRKFQLVDKVMLAASRLDK